MSRADETSHQALPTVPIAGRETTVATPSVLRPLSSITVRPHGRPLSEDHVCSLMRSISEVGLLQPPAALADGTLVAGRHRLEALRRLGWTTIPVLVVTLAGMALELAALDENLVRCELSVLERAEALARRKDLWEGLHPQTRRGGAPGKPGGGKAAPKDDTVSSFAKDAATKAKVSPRTIQRETRLARDLAPDVRDAIRPTPLADDRSELVALARQPVERQREVARLVTTGEAQGAKEALRKIAKAESREAIKSYVAPDGTYPTIAVDPPWPYDNADRDDPGEATFSGVVPYPVMTLDEIRALAVPAAADAVLWLWTTNKFMTAAHEIVAAWGFTTRSIMTWAKDAPINGVWLRGQTEHVLLATRGKPPFAWGRATTLFHAARQTRHSRKPDEFYTLVAELSPGPRIELFARAPREGWVTAGADVSRPPATPPTEQSEAEQFPDGASQDGGGAA